MCNSGDFKGTTSILYCLYPHKTVTTNSKTKKINKTQKQTIKLNNGLLNNFLANASMIQRHDKLVWQA